MNIANQEELLHHVVQPQTPPFPAFDSTAELWKDYLLRFKTFVSANSVSDKKLALVFLTNQTSGTYKLINNYASQQDTPTTADNMTFSDIAELMYKAGIAKGIKHL